MDVYCVEWWNDSDTKYLQEYYQCPALAGSRAKILKQDVPDSQPQLSTIFVDTSNKMHFGVE